MDSHNRMSRPRGLASSSYPRLHNVQRWSSFCFVGLLLVLVKIQRQSTLDCRYLTLLCDNLKKKTSRSKNL
jgi:hypothetical protein